MLKTVVALMYVCIAISTVYECSSGNVQSFSEALPRIFKLFRFFRNIARAVTNNE